jgi:hypothetical protein
VSSHEIPVGGAEEQLFLSYLCRHIVALCGSYVSLNEQGQQSGGPTFYSYTGTVFEILGSWCIVTAGHVLHDLEAAQKCPLLRIEAQVLADFCGTGAKSHAPFPFKPLEEGWVYIDDDSLGLDFGLVFIRPFYRDCLRPSNFTPNLKS